MVGKAITNENAHARSHGRINRSDTPRFRSVMTKDITPDISSDIQRAKTVLRYFAESIFRHPSEGFLVGNTVMITPAAQTKTHPARDFVVL